MLEHVVHDDKIEWTMLPKHVPGDDGGCVAAQEGDVDLVSRVRVGQLQPLVVDVDSDHLSPEFSEFDRETSIGAADVQDTLAPKVDIELVPQQPRGLARSLTTVDLERVTLRMLLGELLDAAEALSLREGGEKGGF